MKNIIISLPYFKQGDDLRCCMNNSKSIKEAFADHANMLRAAAEQLEAVMEIINNDVEVQADTHFISICCPEKMAEKLIEKELGFEEEEE